VACEIRSAAPDLPEMQNGTQNGAVTPYLLGRSLP